MSAIDYVLQRRSHIGRPAGAANSLRSAAQKGRHERRPCAGDCMGQAAHDIRRDKRQCHCRLVPFAGTIRILRPGQGVIFNWKNVRRLRRLGVLLIIGFVCTFLLAFLSFHNVEKVFSVTGYSLSMADMVHITSLVLGISALIVAEVFAIGLKMKEEQELTI